MILNTDELRMFLKERFGITAIPYSFIKIGKSEIRVVSGSVAGSDIYGLKGFVAYTKNLGLTSDFIQLIGKDAKQNTIQLNEKDAKAFASGQKIRIKVRIKKGPVIVKFKSHVLGIGTYDGFYIHGKIKGKRGRKIENKLGN